MSPVSAVAEAVRRSVPARGAPVGLLLAHAVAAVPLGGVGAVLLVWTLWGAPLAPSDDRWAALLLVAAFLLPLGPLVYDWEHRFDRVLALVEGTAAADGWDVERVRSARRRGRRAFLPVLVFAVAFALAFFSLADPNLRALGVDTEQERRVALLVALALAYSVGLGYWMILRLVLVTYAATSSSVPWRPFDPDQAPALEGLSKLAFHTGLLFSWGAVIAPAWALAGEGLPSPAPVLTALGLALFASIGLVAFVVPALRVYAFAQEQKVVVLRRFEAPTEGLLERVLAEPDRAGKLRDQLETVLLARNAVAAESPYPSASITAARIASTLVVPGALFVLDRLL